MTTRIRDFTVAEAIAAEAGTDETPELQLSDTVVVTVPLQPRPPLAASGYFPGTIGGVSGASALNTSHVGIGNREGISMTIMRVNFLIIINDGGAQLNCELRRTSGLGGFVATNAVPGYIPAGAATAGGVFLALKNDTVAAVGAQLVDEILVNTDQSLKIPGPWIINDGILSVNHNAVNRGLRVLFGYEVWPIIRDQRAG